MRDDKRKSLEESYEGLSRAQKTVVVASAMGKVLHHWLTLVPLRWVLMQIRLDMRMKSPR